MLPNTAAIVRWYGDRLRAASFLERFANHVHSYGLGSAGEIVDGDALFALRGCIAQAWTVGELLRAWTATAPAELAARSKAPPTEEKGMLTVW